MLAGDIMKPTPTAQESGIFLDSADIGDRDEEVSHEVSTGVLVGVTLGAIAGITIACVLGLYLYRRIQQRRRIERRKTSMSWLNLAPDESECFLSSSYKVELTRARNAQPSKLRRLGVCSPRRRSASRRLPAFCPLDEASYPSQARKASAHFAYVTCHQNPNTPGLQPLATNRPSLAIRSYQRSMGG